MKKSFLRISIFMLLMSVCACCFLSLNGDKNSVYAATQTAQNCYYLLESENTPYQSTQAVGTIEGSGEFIVGTENLVLTAKANNNYQLVGWQVTYNEQESKTEFFGIDDLNNNSKTITLTASDSTGVSAELVFVESNGYFSNGTFTLSQVFEDLTIVPVFDHIYYQVEINDLIAVSTHEEYVTVGSDTLYYQSSSTDGSITTYVNAYFEIEGNYYYYGEVKSDGTEFYTLHNTLEETTREQKVDYKIGAFRFGDEVSIKFDVDVTDNIKTSTNIDLQSVLLSNFNGAQALVELSDGVSSNYYKTQQDSYLRTISYSINFDVVNSEDYLNEVNLSYHKLYVVDLNIMIDGSPDHKKHSEIFGDLNITSNDITGNVSIYNFYSRTNENNLQFLVKSASDNNSKTFGLSCVQTIAKTIDGANYRYYEFDYLNGLGSTSQYFGDIDQNTEISINYLAVEYYVNFELAEYVIDENLNAQLIEMSGNSLASIALKRGDAPLELTSDSVASVENVGYSFVGFASSFDEAILKSTSYTIDETKPLGTTILLCYQKIEYEIIFANFNTKEIDGTHPLNSVTFTKFSSTQTTETITSAILNNQYDEESDAYLPYTLSLKLKIGDSISISHLINNGFDILGYSLNSEPEQEEFFTTLELTADVITANNLTDKLVIYVFEDLITYSLTYYIEPTKDTNLEQDVIMAYLDVEVSSGVIKQYTLNSDGEYVEITEANGNLNSVVVKIEISELMLNDVVVLKSSAMAEGEGTDAYSYVFNWFTEDNKSTLSYVTSTVDETTYYNHEELVTKTRSIKVVYSMPSTKVLISIDEEYSKLMSDEKFSFNFSITQNGSEPKKDEDNENTYVVVVGEDVTISISDISFGYKFVGYKPGEQDVVEVTELSFNCPITTGINNITLKFQQITYNFSFAQFGSNLNDGEYVQFEYVENNETKLRNFVELNIDNATTSFEKPEGYYVSSVRFGEVLFAEYSTYLQELNSYRNNDDILTYEFNLTREQFVDLVQNFGTTNADGVVEVYVRIDYLLFTYDVSVEYGLTQPKGNSRDNRVEYPSLSLTYVYQGTTTTLTTFINSENVAQFSEIPYGANVTINLLSGTPTGLSVSGWRHKNGDVISQSEYAHSTNYINLGVVVKDIALGYKFSYIAYTIQIQYTQGQGQPVVEINNTEVNLDEIQVTLYDTIKISAGAIRNNGYKFKSISHKVPTYVEYEYNQETWDANCLNLYVKNNSQYVLNTSKTYDSTQQYYQYVEETKVETESPYFEDSDFHVSNYVLDEKKITFVIEYELLQLTITNTLSDKGLGVLLGTSGKGEAKNQIKLEDIISFETSATGKNGVSRSVDEGAFVTFNDTIEITISINSEAFNGTDGKSYDLTKGVKLSSVSVAGQNSSFQTVGTGIYLIKFAICEIMQNISAENIDVVVTLENQKKTVYATTVVKNSPNFYEKLTLWLNPNTYSFGEPNQSLGTAPSIDRDLLFMIKLDISASFKDDYKQYFEISGVQIYCDSLLIDDEQYSAYGLDVGDDWTVTARLMCNLKVIFMVQPKMVYNEGPNFVKTFVCDNNGNAGSQVLTVGEESYNDIQVSSVISSSIRIKYKQTGTNSQELDSVSNCGKYNVIISFNEIENYEWLNQISIEETITLTITPKDLYLTYDASKLGQTSKVYDDTSDWDVEKIYGALKFTDGQSISINYSDILSSASNNLVLENGLAYITSGGKDGRISKANENLYYNVYFYNFNLKNTSFNNNFNLKTNELIITEHVKITRKVLTLTGVNGYVQSKVYDGTNNAELITTQYVAIKNKITGDDVSVNPSKLILQFEDSSVGSNKKVLINTKNILEGKDAQNYYLENLTSSGLTIYPYSLSTNVEGLGEIQIINKRGLVEKDKIDLIPLNSTLVVEPIWVDGVQYANIYGNISKYLKGNNEYAIGYKLSLIVDGKNVAINNNLYLSIPSVENITGLYFLTGSQTGEIDYTYNENLLLIDLAQIDVDVDNIFATQKKILLKVWQIVLIVLLSIAIVVAIILVFVIIRKRKMKEYSVHDKI